MRIFQPVCFKKWENRSKIGQNVSKIGEINQILDFLIRPNSIVNKILNFLKPNSTKFRISLFYLTRFTNLLLIPKVMATWNRNWTLNMIKGKWPWSLRFNYCYPPLWASLELRLGLTLHLFWPHDIHNICGGRGAYCSCLLWNVWGYLVSWLSRWWRWLETIDNSSSTIVIIIQILHI